MTISNRPAPRRRRLSGGARVFLAACLLGAVVALVARLVVGAPPEDVRDGSSGAGPGTTSASWWDTAEHAHR